MTMNVNIHAAKSTLSQLIERVKMGEDVVINKAGKPVAKLVAYQKPKAKRKFGSMKGQIVVNDPNWWKPMTEEEAEKFLTGDDWWL